MISAVVQKLGIIQAFRWLTLRLLNGSVERSDSGCAWKEVSCRHYNHDAYQRELEVFHSCCQTKTVETVFCRYLPSSTGLKPGVNKNEIVLFGPRNRNLAIDFDPVVPHLWRDADPIVAGYNHARILVG